jgi:two-component system nitrogen regulation sensor histidine kinase GlnL
MISFDAIINSLEEAIILFDRSAYVGYMNRTAEELLGRSSRDVVGKSAADILPGEPSFSSLVEKTVREGRSFRGRSATLSVGHTVNADFNLSPFFLNSRIEGAVLSISENINIAEREDYDFDSIVFLIGSIAHEIKNPLGGIKGAAQLLRGKSGDPSIDEYVDLITRETDRLNAILHDYLTICKKPSFNPVNVHEVMEKALQLMSIQVREKQIAVQRLYDPSLPQVRGDDAKLLQVFLNIIKNAVESMKKGGTLHISTAPSKESVRAGGRTKRWALICVKDSGRGIPESDVKKIFMPFYTKKKQGTGLGLALSKKIIKDHGGLIKVKSVRNRGTSLMIYIPFEHHG